MKIACLQFAPELGKLDENIQRAEAILQQTKHLSYLDWLILPELAFTGLFPHFLLCNIVRQLPNVASNYNQSEEMDYVAW
jgi:predicted amidohydrolase